MANEFCHIEIAVTDMAQSREFYHQIFGWEMNPLSDGYITFKPSTGHGGALCHAEGDCPRMLIYIHVEDIDATLNAVEAGGGSVVHPKSLISPEIGYSAMFKDPAGNSIGLFATQ